MDEFRYRRGGRWRLLCWLQVPCFMENLDAQLCHGLLQWAGAHAAPVDLMWGLQRTC